MNTPHRRHHEERIAQKSDPKVGKQKKPIIKTLTKKGPQLHTAHKTITQSQ